MAPKVIDLAYMAGFLDGEGCIYITKTNWHDRIQYQLRIMCSQVNPAPLYFFQSFFGGSVHAEPLRINRKKIYTWEVRSSTAFEVLSLLTPYLKVKKEESQVAL